MPLSLNPFSSILSSAKKAVSSVTNQFGGGGFSEGLNAGMRGLEDKVNQLGGGIGSSLNGLTAGGFGDIGTALKGIGSMMPPSNATCPPFTVPGMKFMAGEPMNPATNRLAGRA
jgi:hypothetical protein